MSEPGDRTIELFERVAGAEVKMQHIAEAIDRLFRKQDELRDELIEALSLARNELSENLTTVSRDLQIMRSAVNRQKMTAVRNGGFIAGVSFAMIALWQALNFMISKLGIVKLWQ